MVWLLKVIFKKSVFRKFRVHPPHKTTGTAQGAKIRGCTALKSQARRKTLRRSAPLAHQVPSPLENIENKTNISYPLIQRSTL